MKRFIRYLYEYQDGQRVRNVGFVKVEQDKEQSVIHIHGKGLRLEGDKKLTLYIIYEQEKELIGICQGSIENVNPAVNYRLSYCENDTGIPENYERINGLIMENNQNRKFAAVWDDMPVDVERMKIWEAAMMPSPKETQEPLYVDEEQSEEQEELEEITEEITEQVSEESEGKVEEQETRKSPKRRYSKISRQGLSRLPRCEWKLANNSFLLHGYYNYHHLLLIEDETCTWLGVPGIYHPREVRAAEAFGFPRFQRIEENQMEWEQEEKNSVDDFGYWCRQVKR